jgi:hypothetical protein
MEELEQSLEVKRIDGEELAELLVSRGKLEWLALFPRRTSIRARRLLDRSSGVVYVLREPSGPTSPCQSNSTIGRER